MGVYNILMKAFLTPFILYTAALIYGKISEIVPYQYSIYFTLGFLVTVIFSVVRILTYDFEKL